jgi:hypothetical protein
MPVLLVTGGSQGARSLNQALAGAVAAIRAAGIQVLHVAGPKNIGEVTAPAGRVPYVAVPYVDRMDLAYAAADFALCRSGAMTCAELTAVGLPAAYVPLPHGNGEQRLNALPIVQQGGGLLIEDAELTAEWLTSTLLPVLTNVDRVVAMSEAAASLGRKDADRALARIDLDVIGRAPGRGANDAASAGDVAGPADARGSQGGMGATYQSAPVPEGGFFQPSQERAASQRAARRPPYGGPLRSAGGGLPEPPRSPGALQPPRGALGSPAEGRSHHRPSLPTAARPPAPGRHRQAR